MKRTGKCLRKASVFLLMLTLIISALPNRMQVFAESFDYATALKYAIEFYDANKCGKEAVDDNVFEWRKGPCHITDGVDVGLDLTGGYHDAGDHVKFGLPQGYAASVLGWSIYEFRDVFDATGNTEKMLSQLKYFTDYFLRCHPNPTTFYYQLGDGIIDHQYWGAPELQTGDRPALYVANPSNPATDIVGETVAALALMYLNYKSIDSAYADKCLKAAKELYQLCKASPKIGDYQFFYQSTSMYDDLAWGAIWLYVAEKNEQYMTEAKDYALQKNINQEDPLKNKWTMCWDNMYLAAHLKIAELTGDTTFKTSVQSNLDYWINTLDKTPAGLRVLHYWGVLRYAAAESMVAFLFNRVSPNQKYLDFAQSQMDYILGKNPANMSYEVGFGTKWSSFVHHRAAQGGQGYENNADKTPAKYVLRGALIGGPDKTDTFKESVDEYQYTEVAIDYNAAFVGALAGMAKHFGAQVSIRPTPTPVVTPTSSNQNDYKITGYISPDFSVPSQYAAYIKGGFKVEVKDADVEAITDSNGFFEISGVSGSLSGHTLIISKKNYLKREISKVVVNGNVQLSTSTSPILMWIGDTNGDGAINMSDIMAYALVFNSTSGDGKYKQDLDVNQDGAINMSDIINVAKHFSASVISYS
ncbi:glycoside hydrolase family 9 protein [Pseudobacteroides cellulosolvens]|uniref:Cellulase n=1 Tax=Pseudobacteroides cellulosolvens ATCC 35603 = DSM 2933 TaxID=398512 RepID=A0A0L6JMZ6_9FIRM|nr:glycoside hydrolase family 9 protein [Pseudobacteroides cellulosolvens]KNY26737.1 Cellulase [Pseudobacteroides cellulosolvens ATCC 35603 = DSM 2933]